MFGGLRGGFFNSKPPTQSKPSTTSSTSSKSCSSSSSSSSAPTAKLSKNQSKIDEDIEEIITPGAAALRLNEMGSERLESRKKKKKRKKS